MTIKYDADGNLITPAHWTPERIACGNEAAYILLELKRIAGTDNKNEKLLDMFGLFLAMAIAEIGAPQALKLFEAFSTFINARRNAAKPDHLVERA
jgi:hypothetical protein